jgi:Protein O-mannosyl-transferase TMEM260-like/Tetratricopeptide repeat
MKLSQRKYEFIRSHFRRHGDERLASALNVDKAAVRMVREQNKLSRTKDEVAWIKDNPDADLPEYTRQAPIPKNTVTLRLPDCLAGVFVYVAAFAVYLRTVAPTVTGEDNGELVTAAYKLGIAHPPGYPLWCMLGKLFTMILPFGTIAWRVNVMSSFFGACTALIACLIVIKLTRSRMAGIASGLALAFSSEFWEQSGIAEVYSLNAFFIVTCIFILFLWYEQRRTWLLMLFAVVYGLSLCNHNTMHFLGPLFGLFIIAVDGEPWRRWRTYVTMGALAGAAWLIHIYLPIRSLADPPVDWGNPETWEGFWDVIMRKQYSFGFKENPRSAARVLKQIAVVGKLYAHQFTPWLAVLPLFGIYALWKRDRFRFALIVGTLCYITAGFIFVLNFKLDKENIWVNNVFFIPAYMMAAILMGPAIAWIATVKVKGTRLLPVAILLALAAALLPLVGHFHQNDKSQYYFARDYGTNILNTLDQDAIYFPTADHATFPVLYLQAVEGVRPDVTIANKYGYPEEVVYADMPYELRSQFGTIPSEVQEHIIEDWVIANTDRPVYFTKKRPIQSMPGAEMVPAGLVYKAVRPTEDRPDHDFWADYTWHTLDPADTRGEFSAELILADYHFFQGAAHFESGRQDDGLASFEQAIQIAGETKEALNNLGSACAEYACLDASLCYYERAHAIDPDYEMVLRNLSKVYIQLGRHRQAIPLFQRIFAKQPDDPEANALLVDCLIADGRPDAAIAHLHQRLERTPEDAGIYRQLGMIYLNEKRDTTMARTMFTRSLALNPNQPELTMLISGAQDPMADQPGAPNMPGIPGVNLPNMPDISGMTMPQLPTAPGP